MQLPRFRGSFRGLPVAGLFLVPLTLGCATGRYDPAISEWKPDGGWRPIRGVGARKPSPERLKRESREAFDANSHRDALLGYLALKERHASSPEAKDISIPFHIAECYYQIGEGEYYKAYSYYLEVLKGNPPQEMLSTTLGRIYDIGIAFLYGRAKRTFLGIPYRSPSYGVEILTGPDGLVTNYPFLELSEDALMEVGKHYFTAEDYLEAEQVYEKMARDYPQSKRNPAAEYQLSLSVYRQIRGVDYDQVAIGRGRTKFNSYLSHHPRGGQVEEARGFLRELSEMEGQHDLRIAKYYLRESYPEAAKLYLRSVVINNTGTDAAREAREIFENLEKRKAGL